MADRHDKLLDATVAFEHAALRPPYILNGGAAVYVLAFAAQLELKIVGDLVWPLALWVAGLVLASGATGAGYVSQFQFLKEERRKAEGETAKAEGHGKRGVWSRRVAYCCAGASIFVFAVGAGIALYEVHTAATAEIAPPITQE